MAKEAIRVHMVKCHRRPSFFPLDLSSISVENVLYAACWGYSSEQEDWVSALNQFSVYLSKLVPFVFFGRAGGLVGSSLTRDGTRAPVMEAWSPNHWTAREFPL